MVASFFRNSGRLAQIFWQSSIELCQKICFFDSMLNTKSVV